MKNILILFLLATLFTSNLEKTKITDCGDFYIHSNLLNDSFRGKVLTKKETELTYVFSLEQNKILKLFKNNLSRNVFLFVHNGDIIKKKKGVLSLSVAHFKEDGGVHVKLFNKLCD